MARKEGQKIRSKKRENAHMAHRIYIFYFRRFRKYFYIENSTRGHVDKQRRFEQTDDSRTYLANKTFFFLNTNERTNKRESRWLFYNFRDFFAYRFKIRGAVTDVQISREDPRYFNVRTTFHFVQAQTKYVRVTFLK